MDDRAEFEQWVETLGIRRPTYFEVWQAATARQRERDAEMVDEWKALVSHTDYGAIPSKKSMLEVLIYVASCIRDSGKPAEAIRRQP